MGVNRLRRVERLERLERLELQSCSTRNDWNDLNVWNPIRLGMLHADGEHPLQVMARVHTERD